MPIPAAPLPGLDKPVSRLILGCGGFSPERQEQVNSLLDAFVAMGGTALDTAHIYGRDGASERAVGAWLAARGRPAGVVVITKGAHPDPEWHPRVRPEVIVRELRESLERLGLDRVDLYLLHRDDPAAPVGPILECLNEQVAAGRMTAFGGSNWSPARLAEANAYAAAHGLRGFSASSPHLALALARDPAHMGHSIVSGDAAALEWYRETHLPLLAWTSQARGFFSERADPDSPEARRRFRRFDAEDNWERRRRVLELGARRRVPPTQIALAWVLQQGSHVFPIIGSGSVAHLEDAAAALEVRLSPEEWAWVDLRA